MAKNSVLDIIIRTIAQGDGSKKTVQQLAQIKGAITGGLAAFAALAGAAYAVEKVLGATVGVYAKYVQNVTDVGRATGLSADESSRLIAMTDDLGISYEDLSTAIKKNTKTTDFSIEGLATSSAAYLNLSDAQDRAAFAQQHYGKQWVEFSKLLVKGPGEVRAMAAAVDEAHLFDKEDQKRVEEYRIATDQLHDAWEGFAMAIGEVILPPLTDLMNGELDAQRAQELAKKAGEDYLQYPQLQAKGYVALASAAREAATASKIEAEGLRAASDAAKDSTIAHGDLLDAMLKMNGATREQIRLEGYQELKKKLTESGGILTDQEALLLEAAGLSLGLFDINAVNAAQSIEALTTALANGQITLDAFVKGLNAIPTNVNTTLTVSTSGAGAGPYMPPGSCFIAGTTIAMADGSLKEIEDVIAGDEVISYDLDRKALITARVEGTYVHTGDEMGEAYLLINGRIGVTPNHLLYVNGEWAAAGTLKHGDWLRTQDDYEMIETVTWIDRRVPTYNLHIEHESHNYFADGILAHNKAGGGLARGPGSSMVDSFWAPLANGEFVVNAGAVAQPGMLDLLQAINSGKMSGGKSMVIQNLTVVAQGSVMDVLEELG